MNKRDEAGGSRVGSLLKRTFFRGEVESLARRLLGTCLVRETADGRTAGIIVEVEAYRHGDDPASHSFRGLTRRNASMFGPPGIAYVYTIHNKFCVNVVAEPAERGAAVLIRALQPLEGLEIMARRRGRDDVRQLTSGPGKLCQALAIDRELDGWDLTRGEALWIERGPRPKDWQLAASPRIGIRRGQDLLLRFFMRGNRFVSKRAQG
jgi:DNA-3-methyladenine glycosylase